LDSLQPDGQYLLAQDDAGINVLTREPFAQLFRIDTPDYAYYAKFSPDSREIIFLTENLRVERWSVADQKQLEVDEVVLRKGCLETELSPDGKLLACLIRNLSWLSSMCSQATRCGPRKIFSLPIISST
jgi:hypothetical protein